MKSPISWAPLSSGLTLTCSMTNTDSPVIYWSACTPKINSAYSLLVFGLVKWKKLRPIYIIGTNIYSLLQLLCLISAGRRLQFLLISKHDFPSEYLSKFLRNPLYLGLLANPWGPLAPSSSSLCSYSASRLNSNTVLGPHNIGRASKPRRVNCGAQRMQAHHVKVTLHASTNQRPFLVLSLKKW